MGKPKALVSWSGGKDCCLAAWRARAQHDIVGLVSMMNESGERSRSHGLPRPVLAAQADSLGLPLFTAPAAWSDYEAQFIALLTRAAAERAATHVIFGDIFPDPHRAWCERVCAAADLAAVEPLWAESTAALAAEFLHAGGEAIFVTVRGSVLGPEWLGRRLDREALAELARLGLDPGGENGEYHTLTTYFPGFARPLSPRPGAVLQHADCWLLGLDPGLKAHAWLRATL